MMTSLPMLPCLSVLSLKATGLGSLPSGLCCRGERLPEGALHTGQQDTPAIKEPEDSALYCAFCRHPLTSTTAAISRAGLHQHTFFNPAGIVFEVRCFADAPGCLMRGAPSHEFSWFAGYAWMLALCGRCQAHVGWRYQGEDGHFYGLIAQTLREGFS